MPLPHHPFRVRPELRPLAFAAIGFSLLLSGCFVLRSSEGGGEARFRGRPVNAADVSVPAGYRIEAVATGLMFPTGIAFDGQGRAYVTEAGYSYGGYSGTPRLLRIEADGSTTEITAGTNPPWNGVDFHDGSFYVAGGHVDGGRIIRVGPDGSQSVIVDGLPSMGDHHTNGPLAGADGWIYFGQGTATNSGVVGEDNFNLGWLKRHPEFHDVPCEDVTLTGANHESENPLTENRRDKAVTGAYVPFGTQTTPGQIIPGRVPCSGAILRVRPTGGAPELVAWGLRNPFGLAWSPEGELYATDNQYDVRGSRPVFGTGDLLWRIEEGAWYGWPDYTGDELLTEKYEAPREHEPKFLLRSYPGEPPRPAAVLGVHSSSNGMDFSPGASFGYEGEVFIAQFGDQASAVGKVLSPVGYKVVRVDPKTGVSEDFAVNEGRRNGPASYLGRGGLERPVAVRFDPTGRSLYVVDWGVMNVYDDEIVSRPETGVIWRITREEGSR